MMSDQLISILADDLTGACDAIAPFASQTRPAWVTWKLENVERNSAAALSVCTNSRACDATMAIERSRQSVRAMLEAGRRRVFLKMDSTLKGHWAREVTAIMDEMRLYAALVAPAYPAMGRCVVDGRLQMRGKVDAGQPSIAAILEGSGQVTAMQLSCQELRKSTASLARLIALKRHEKRIFGCDTLDDRDLDAVAEIVELLADSILPVGSRGLTGSLAKRQLKSLPNQSHLDRVSMARPASDGEASPVVVMAGSNNPVTDSQLTDLAENLPVTCFDLSDTVPSRFSALLRGNQHVVVRVDWRIGQRQQLHRLIDVCQHESIAGMLLTGGDTAQLVCDQCGTSGIWIEGEVLPGLPRGRFEQGKLHRTRVVTKAGGFGDKNAIVRAVKWLREAGQDID